MKEICETAVDNHIKICDKAVDDMVKMHLEMEK